MNLEDVIKVFGAVAPQEPEKPVFVDLEDDDDDGLPREVGEVHLDENGFDKRYNDAFEHDGAYADDDIDLH
jgi:hypothetical protein